MEKRTLAELINREDPAWPLVLDWIKEGKNHAEILPASKCAGEKALLELQVTTRSPMGAITLESGGIFIDHGWLRILGAGTGREEDVKTATEGGENTSSHADADVVACSNSAPNFAAHSGPIMERSLPGWNKLIGNDINSGQVPPFLLVADDVIGGFFAIDHGTFGNPSKVFYFSPDSLEWEDTEKGYTDFILWCLNGDLDQFYGEFRWTGWQDEVAELTGDQGFTIYPFPFADGPPMGQRSRGAAPMSELFGLYTGDLREQLGIQSPD